MNIEDSQETDVKLSKPNIVSRKIIKSRGNGEWHKLDSNKDINIKYIDSNSKGSIT